MPKHFFDRDRCGDFFTTHFNDGALQRHLDFCFACVPNSRSIHQLVKAFDDRILETKCWSQTKGGAFGLTDLLVTVCENNVTFD